MTAVDPAAPGDGAVPRQHDRAARAFCLSREERALLKQLVEVIRGKEQAASNIFAADSTQALAGLQKLSACFQSFGATTFVQQLLDARRDAQLPHDDGHLWHVGEFLRCLASPSPVDTYLPLRAAAVVRDWLECSPAGDMAQLDLAELSEHAPHAARFLAAWAALHPSSSLHPDVLAILHQLVATTELIYQPPRGGDTSRFDVLLAPGRASSCSTAECLDTGICCGLPQVRLRPAFALDGPADKQKECRHAFIAGSRGSRRTGGLFIFMCKHGIVYGFFILPNAEGRDEAFSFLYKYFVRMPRLIIYDFACALHEFALNRCPHLFKDTTFAVDRFHWFNHTACAPSYNLNKYVQYAHINSQAVEQMNSMLQAVKPCISQMTQRNFMFIMRLFVDVRNSMRSSILEEERRLVHENNMR